MQQLTGLDTAFLVLEAGGQLGHVGSLCLYDPKGLRGRSLAEAFSAALAERLHLLPPYRRRLVEVPLGLDRPYWVEDPHFDLDYHVRHIAVPAPGDEQQLAGLVARIHGRALDRARPLWEAYVIEGCADGLVAIYTKIHHCTIDGVSGAELLQVLLDRSPSGDAVVPLAQQAPAESIPGALEMLGRGVLGLARQPDRIARTAYRTLRDLGRQPGAFGAAAKTLGLDRLPLAGGLLRRRGPQLDADPIPQTPAPHTPWNRSITPHRRFAYFSLPLARVKQVKSAFGTTLNDVVMAISAAALRRYLLDRNALPDTPLVAMVPVSVRSAEQKHEFTNRVTSILAELATDEENPLASLRRIAAAMQAAKRMQQAVPANLLQDWTQVTTPRMKGLPLTDARVMRLSSRPYPAKQRGCLILPPRSQP
jgi:WS/DGAT/MGAT family acyltransferase